MSRIRFSAIEQTFNRKPVRIEEQGRRSDIYGSQVFGKEAMLQYLSKEAYKAVKSAIEKGEKISRDISDQVAAGMKTWAIAKGATHYTHWFQPLTGFSAEKHDSFFEKLPDGDVLEKFGGSQLVQQEPDASSFPSGGIRNTFEARGYTAWDPTSPAFIYETTLCIPTIFISYTGHALDYKTPLLRSIQALDREATLVAKYFNRNTKKVLPTLGWEQEYFLIDAALFKSREDLILTGRTLVGHPPAKGQQLDDHYFGSIPERVLSFMRDLEIESLKLGIPVKTRHNEVAPNQFELAPIFEEANLAVDHNTLIMDIMSKVARRHDFEVLLHEKPFEGINGSGKHNNWSLMTDTGKNLLSPGETPMKNMQFLTFFVNTIKAVNDNEALLRAFIASAGNDHRLGANEAPPAIISVFIGDQLTKVLHQIKNFKEGKLTPDEKTDMKLNIVGKIPEVLLDNTDRNRTSPFAFTGNKFEFRAVGSSANCAGPMFALNTMVAKQLKEFRKEVEALIEKKGLKKDVAIFNVIQSYIKQSERILFEQDGYSSDWEKEAKKRGLSNNKTTPEALGAKIDKSSIQLFEEMGVLTEEEVHARYEVETHQYYTQIEIEAGVLDNLVLNHIIPTAIQYQQQLVDVVSGLKELFGKDYKEMAKEQLGILSRVSYLINEVTTHVRGMRNALNKAASIDNSGKKAMYYAKEVKPIFDLIRGGADELEMMISDELWPLTKYRELLFTR